MGILLKKVRYVVKQPQSDFDIAGNNIMTVSTFPFNPESKTAPDTARRWASSGWNVKSDFVAPEVEFDNDPFSVRLIRLEKRAEGGRAYKVIDSCGRLFDLREDQLIEAIKLGGIEAGGQIKGTFVWGMRGSQMTLVYYGGKEYKSMAAERKRRDATSVGKNDSRKRSAITAKSVVQGGLYIINKKYYANALIYLGRVRVPGVKTPYHVTIDFYSDSYRRTPGNFKHKIDASLAPENMSDQDLLDHLCAYDERFLTDDPPHDTRYGRSYPLQQHFDVTLRTSVGFDEYRSTLDVGRLKKLVTSGALHFENGHGEELATRMYEDLMPTDPKPKYMHVGDFYERVAEWEKRANAWFAKKIEWIEKR